MSDERSDVDQSMSTSLASNTNAGIRQENHDERSQANEIIQSLIENRRQEVAQFEQRMTQENQMFQATMQQALQNMDNANARANNLAMRESAATVAMHYADVGALTIIP